MAKRGRPAGDKSLEWFANWRKEWFSSQEALGTLLGFGRDNGNPATQVSNWETGRNGVNVGLLRRALLKTSGRPREALEDFEYKLKRNRAATTGLGLPGLGLPPRVTTNFPLDQLSLTQLTELKVSGVPVDDGQGLMELVRLLLTKARLTPGEPELSFFIRLARSIERTYLENHPLAASMGQDYVLTLDLEGLKAHGVFAQFMPPLSLLPGTKIGRPESDRSPGPILKQGEEIKYRNLSYWLSVQAELRRDRESKRLPSKEVFAQIAADRLPKEADRVEMEIQRELDTEVIGNTVEELWARGLTEVFLEDFNVKAISHFGLAWEYRKACYRHLLKPHPRWLDLSTDGMQKLHSVLSGDIAAGFSKISLSRQRPDGKV